MVYTHIVERVYLDSDISRCMLSACIWIVLRIQITLHYFSYIRSWVILKYDFPLVESKIAILLQEFNSYEYY